CGGTTAAARMPVCRRNSSASQRWGYGSGRRLRGGGGGLPGGFVGSSPPLVWGGQLIWALAEGGEGGPAQIDWPSLWEGRKDRSAGQSEEQRLKALTELLHWVEITPVAIFVSHSTYGFAAIDMFHIAAISVVFGMIATLDLRLTGVALADFSI